MLPALDQRYLDDRQVDHQVQVDQGMLCILLPDWPLPAGLTIDRVDLLLRLAPGYPDIAPDMWWVSPDVQRSDGQAIPATEVTENILGRRWQRWSRHFQSGQWQSGIDGLESFLALIRSTFLEAAAMCAA